MHLLQAGVVDRLLAPLLVALHQEEHAEVHGHEPRLLALGGPLSRHRPSAPFLLSCDDRRGGGPMRVTRWLVLALVLATGVAPVAAQPVEISFYCPVVVG